MKRSISFAALVILSLPTVVLAQGKPSVTWAPASSNNYRRGRSQRISMVVIHTIEGSASSGINTFRGSERRVSAHYVVAPDGAIAQCVKDEDTAWHAGQVNGRAIGIEHAGFSGRRDTWTPALLRASARLTRWLCDTYGIPIDRQHIVGHMECPGATHGDPGRYFDWDLYMRLVRGESASITNPRTGETDTGTGSGSGAGSGSGSGVSDGSGSNGSGGSNGATGGRDANGRPIRGIANSLEDGGRIAPDGRVRNHDNGYGKKNPLLEHGSKGEDVKRLQKILNAAGVGPLDEDGVFGKKTEAALKKFQRKNGCDVDGIAGPETWRALNKVKVPEPVAARSSGTSANDSDGLPLPVRPGR